MADDEEHGNDASTADDRQTPRASSAFHIPSRHYCICQFCHRSWPCPDADPDRWPRIYEFPDV